MKIKEYLLIRGLPILVENKVNELLKTGWDIYGNPHTMNLKTEDTTIIIQPMVKYDK